MKISNFKALIREAVREELRASLPNLLRENAVLESKKPSVKKSDFMEGISHAMNLQDQVKSSIIKDRKKYSKGMSLTEALADTAASGQHIPNETNPYPVLDKMFTSADVSQAATSPDGRPVNLDKVSDVVIDNLTKDYSQLMKKLDEKTAAKRG
jgi:hypothetical protein